MPQYTVRTFNARCKPFSGRHAERALQFFVFPGIPANHQRDDNKQPEETRVGEFYSVKPTHLGISSVAAGACGSCLICIIKLMALSMLCSLSCGTGFSLANFTRSAITSICLSLLSPSTDMPAFLMDANISSEVCSSAWIWYLFS